jgi:DNA-directed RNA polymerase subunit RPC12/RpoP
VLANYVCGRCRRNAKVPEQAQVPNNTGRRTKANKGRQDNTNTRSDRQFDTCKQFDTYICTSHLFSPFYYQINELSIPSRSLTGRPSRPTQGSSSSSSSHRQCRCWWCNVKVAVAPRRTFVLALLIQHVRPSSKTHASQQSLQ